MTSESNPIATRASQLGGPGSVPPILDGDIFKLPVFSFDFVSAAWPEANGPVRLRYPSFGDEVEIERLAVLSGGTMLARAQATFVVCLEAAPPNWWRPHPNVATNPGAPPVPATDRLPCSPELVDLWSRWISWRDSFRSGSQTKSAVGADEPAGGPVVGG